MAAIRIRFHWVPGNGHFTFVDRPPSRSHARIGPDNVAQNGSGYRCSGSNKSTFGPQVRQAVSTDTDLVVFFGSKYGRGHARGWAPACSNHPEVKRLAARDAVQAAAGAVGEKFVDPIAVGWIVVDVGDVGDVDDLVGPDGVHPSLAGQHDLRANMEPPVVDALRR